MKDYKIKFYFIIKNSLILLQILDCKFDYEDCGEPESEEDDSGQSYILHEYNDFYIKTCHNPELTEDCFYIYGSDESSNNRLCDRYFRDNNSAQKYAKKLFDALEDYAGQKAEYHGNGIYTI